MRGKATGKAQALSKKTAKTKKGPDLKISRLKIDSFKTSQQAVNEMFRILATI